MMWREGKVPNTHLIALAVLSLAVYVGAQKTTRREPRPRYATKIEAAQTVSLAQQAIRDELRRSGHPIDLTNDPWETGLIGEEHTEITSDRGFIAPKILATNPNAAAAFVDMLVQAGVETGDRVAIGMTGSIPGWNISMLAACKAMGVTAIVITSVGASDWGANRPYLTGLDMERVLRDRDILPYVSVAASLGGGGDRGRGLSPKGRRLLREAIARNGVTFLETKTLENGIAERMKTYEQYSGEKGYAAYINIGGGVASLGGRYNSELIRSGYSRRLSPANYPVNAVINRMSRQGVPVINLTDVNTISERYGPAIVTADRPELGVGALYYKERVDVTMIVLLTVFLGAVVFVVIRIDLKRYVRRNPRVRSLEEAV
jgi:poly-gamma-glutamate system protein